MEEDCAAHLLSIVSQGQLMAWLTALEPGGEERRRAIDCLAQLHRTRRIDVFEHLHRPSGADEWRVDYGSWTRVYRDLFPLLDDDARTVVSAAVRLGTRLWEPTFHEAFLDWCMRDRKRIDEVLALEPVPEVPDFCFAAALIAGLRTDPATYLDAAVKYAQGNRRSRMPGIRAIGAMSVENDAAVRRAVTVVGGVLDDAHAAVGDRADALTAALEVAQRCAGSLDGPVSEMVVRATTYGRAELLQACCHILVRFGPQLRDSLLPSLLEALRALDIDAPEARSTADMTIYSLLTRGRMEEALASLAILLRKSKARDTLDTLSSTAHYLANPAANLLPVVTCRWLLTGDRALCAAARHLLTSRGDQKFKFDFDPGNWNWPDGRAVYLARKAIGWLMPHGTAPASFVICLLRAASEDAAKELGELLFDPLLVNYPLATRAYLEEVCQSLPAKAKACVETVLARDDLYKQAIEDVGLVPELQPTDRHRRIEAERQAERLAKAGREAEGKSVLAHLATRQTLLYGARAINYVDDPGGGTRRLDNRLKTFSYTADNAMGWIYDPFGLDYMLRVFRAEQNSK
jgi:hypothetical protein